MQMFDVVHLIHNQWGMEIHIDPFGPANPLHLGIQVIGGWLGGTREYPQMACTASGCNYSGGEQ